MATIWHRNGGTAQAAFYERKVNHDVFRKLTWLDPDGHAGPNVLRFGELVLMGREARRFGATEQSSEPA